MTDRKEEVIPVDEVVEYFEETQPDGSVVRKKKTIRKSKRVIITTSSQPVSEGERITTTTTTSTSASNTTHQGPGTQAIHGSEGTEKQEEQEAQRDIVEDASGTTKASEEKGAVVGHIHHSSGAAEDSSSSATTTTGRTFKYRVFGEGDVGEHPFYRFLAMFPLKQLPAPHTRPRPVKAIIYAYGPGWHAGQTTPAASSKSAIGSFDVDSLKWMASEGHLFTYPLACFILRFSLANAMEPSAILIVLFFQTYLKFNQIEFEVKPAFEPNMSPSGKLPFLALPNGSFVTADGFEAWVQENKPKSAGVKLDHHEAAEALAFINLAESKIHAALVS
jgi:hypothetical protein